MPTTTTKTLALTLCASALSLNPAFAQDAAPSTFAAPVRIQAGDKHLGQTRLFPSPVWHDMNGDGRLDLVVGDLRGRLTVALRKAGGGAAEYEADTPLTAADGKEIDFHNW